ncbi:hypothetical protein GSVR_33940 [Geobacter sp. SVR]|nr:hypothetical protein GSVR_33940 [Geobacter sp. SVR]
MAAVSRGQRRSFCGNVTGCYRATGSGIATASLALCLSGKIAFVLIPEDSYDYDQQYKQTYIHHDVTPLSTVW